MTYQPQLESTITENWNLGFKVIGFVAGPLEFIPRPWLWILLRNTPRNGMRDVGSRAERIFGIIVG
jgi:hypothetical protein